LEVFKNHRTGFDAQTDSEKSKNWVKEHTINLWFCHEKCQFFENFLKPEVFSILKILKEPELDVFLIMKISNNCNWRFLKFY
jgi:hypothetical protein